MQFDDRKDCGSWSHWLHILVLKIPCSKSNRRGAYISFLQRGPVGYTNPFLEILRQTGNNAHFSRGFWDLQTWFFQNNNIQKKLFFKRQGKLRQVDWILSNNTMFIIVIYELNLSPMYKTDDSFTSWLLLWTHVILFILSQSQQYQRK